MLNYRTTHSPRSNETSPCGHPETPCSRGCGCGCNEWVTDWWMPPDPPHPPAALPSASDAVIATETDRATSAADPSTRLVEPSTMAVDRATRTVDRRTEPVERL